MGQAGEITRLFEAAANGDESAFDAIVARVYGELEDLAGRQMRHRFGGLSGLTLEPAALVNETLLRVLRQPRSFANRRHFFAFCSRVMRRVLVDYQRSRGRQKRGGGMLKVTLTELSATPSDPVAANAGDVVEALERLEHLDPRKAEVVQLRVFWGLEMNEIAATLEVSLATIERDWRFSRSWLAKELRVA